MKFNKKTKTIVLAFTIITLFSGLAALQSCRVHKPSFKGVDLQKSYSLQGSGLTQQGLDNLTQYLKEKSVTTGMVVLYDGKLVYEYGDISEVKLPCFVP